MSVQMPVIANPRMRRAESGGSSLARADSRLSERLSHADRSGRRMLSNNSSMPGNMFPKRSMNTSSIPVGVSGMGHPSATAGFSMPGASKPSSNTLPRTGSRKRQSTYNSSSDDSSGDASVANQDKFLRRLPKTVSRGAVSAKSYNSSYDESFGGVPNDRPSFTNPRLTALRAGANGKKSEKPSRDSSADLESSCSFNSTAGSVIAPQIVYQYSEQLGWFPCVALAVMPPGMVAPGVPMGMPEVEESPQQTLGLDKNGFSSQASRGLPTKVTDASWQNVVSAHHHQNHQNAPLHAPPPGLAPRAGGVLARSSSAVSSYSECASETSTSNDYGSSSAFSNGPMMAGGFKIDNSGSSSSNSKKNMSSSGRSLTVSTRAGSISSNAGEISDRDPFGFDKFGSMGLGCFDAIEEGEEEEDVATFKKAPPNVPVREVEETTRDASYKSDKSLHSIAEEDEEEDSDA